MPEWIGLPWGISDVKSVSLQLCDVADYKISSIFTYNIMISVSSFTDHSEQLVTKGTLVEKREHRRMF